MEPTRKAIGYVRVSTASQVTDGDGLAIQRAKIEAWTKYEGVELLGIEEDAGVSGSTMDRPGLRRVLRQALEHGHGAILVVYRLDRVGRTAIDVQEVLALLLDAGVRVVSICDGVDSGSGMGATILTLLTNLLASISEIEKSTITLRLLDGRKRADADDRPYGREPRYGRQTVVAEGRLAPAEDELIAIERMGVGEPRSEAVCPHDPAQRDGCGVGAARDLLGGGAGPNAARSLAGRLGLAHQHFRSVFVQCDLAGRHL